MQHCEFTEYEVSCSLMTAALERQLMCVNNDDFEVVSMHYDGVFKNTGELYRISTFNMFGPFQEEAPYYNDHRYIPALYALERFDNEHIEVLYVRIEILEHSTGKLFQASAGTPVFSGLPVF